MRDSDYTRKFTEHVLSHRTLAMIWDNEFCSDRRRSNEEDGEQNEKKGSSIDWEYILENIMLPHWKDTRTILHYAIGLNAPPHIVERIVTAFPDSTLAQDDNGCTPLHYACQCSESTNVLEILIRSNQRALHIQDILGETPLHLACQEKISADFTWIILHFEPRAVFTRNNILDDKSPLDSLMDYFWTEDALCRPQAWNQWQKLIYMLRAAYHGAIYVSDYWDRLRCLDFHAALAQTSCPSSVLATIARVNLKDCAKVSDEYGNYPLHLALASFRNSNTIDKIISSLLFIYPQAASASNSRGKTALLLALESGKKNCFVEELIHAAPESLNIRDPISGLFPFMIAATEYNSDLDTIYSLLHNAPYVLNRIIN